MANILDKLKLDEWYMLFVYIGGIAFLLSLFVPVQSFDNKNISILACGILLIGLGEWKNRGWLQQFKPPNLYTGGPALMTAKVRMPNAVGISFVIIGLFLLVLAIIQITNIYQLL